MVTLILTLEPGGEEEGLCWLGPAEAVLALHDHLVPRVGSQTLELKRKSTRRYARLRYINGAKLRAWCDWT